MNSRVHPTYKTKYRVSNWASYDRALVGRGDVTLWVSPEAIATWEPLSVGTRGGPQKYSDVAIETALTLRLLFHLPLRQAEGFLQSLFGMMGIDLAAPDHTTLSRRGQLLDVPLRRVTTGKGLHGVRGTRGWKKLHLAVDRSGVIVAEALTEGHVDDATTALHLIDAVDGDTASVTADGAYDSIAIYDAAGARGASVVVPPTKTARVSRRRPRSTARDRTIKKVRAIGRCRWKKASGYHRQARVENVFFRYKSIIGDGLRARSLAGQGTEAILACNILNQMTQRGRPASYAVGR
jgi:DDE family transposase